MTQTDGAPTASQDTQLASWADQLLQPARYVASDELATIRAAGQAIAHRITGGARLVTFGAGHSWCLAAELSYRAGGLPEVIAAHLGDVMPEPHEAAWMYLADSEPERLPELGQALIDHHQIAPGDALLIATNSARNGAIVELARRATEQGTLVVAIVSRAHGAAVASRHPSGLKASDFADFVIDNHGTAGDAAIEFAPGHLGGATSTIAGALIAQMLALVIAEAVTRTDGEFATLRSANLDPKGDH
ncbi:MAG: sugar isomerase domain-containing protein [Bifidobacteriaceae bacterium]|jgi:uncharacterized phosphosugar-binding protein|nr:sugar isomerase domain-containing protein [Bifidobacteriaceae bacterium]